MKLKTLLGSFLLCAVPVASQYIVDTIPDIDFVNELFLYNEMLVVSGTDDGDSGSLSIVKNMVKTKVLKGNSTENGPKSLIKYGNPLYFTYNDMSSGKAGKDFSDLWSIDSSGTPAKLDNGNIGGLSSAMAYMCYHKYTDSTGYEFWGKNQFNASSTFLADLNPGPGSSYPFGFTSTNSGMFFFADVPGYGVEMCFTTTYDTARLLIDLCPGPRGSVPTFSRQIEGVMVNEVDPKFKVVSIGDDHYFLADDSIHGYELWFSNGRESGTKLVKDITPGTGSSFAKFDSLNSPLFQGLNGNLYFVPNDPVYGKELWCTDGTDANTFMIKDINPGSASSGITELVIDGKYVYFAADDGVHGLEIWRTDGTVSGTILYSDIQPQTFASTGSCPRNLTVHYDGKLYFTTECLIEDSMEINGVTVPYDSAVKSLYRIDDVLGITEKILDFPPDELVSEDHMLIPSVQGLFFRGVTPYSQRLCRLRIFDQLPYFVNEPDSTNAVIGVHYAYNFTFEDPDGQPITLYSSARGGFASWCDSSINQGAIRGIPNSAGDFEVYLALTSSPSPPVIKRFYIHVPEIVSFASKPDTNLVINVPFNYNISVVDPGGNPITITAQNLCGWLTFEDFGDGTALLSATPTQLGSCDVELFAISSSIPVPVRQSFRVMVRNPDTLAFTSTPVTDAVAGTNYNYDIKVADSYGQPITVTPVNLPSWMTFSNENMSISGTPDSIGDYDVLLKATTSRIPLGVTQSFTINVTTPINLVAYSYEEMVNAPSQSNPRLYILNNGATDVSDFRVEYYFLVENGKTPVLDRYYTGDCLVSMTLVNGGYYKIVYDYTGKTIHSGQILPSAAGSVIGIHYNDYSIWNKSNDYSNNLSNSFLQNEKICIYKQDKCVFGTPTDFRSSPVARAGNSIAVTDTGDSGVSIFLNSNGSYDPDGIIINYEWYVDGVLSATGNAGYVTLGPGIYTVTLKVTDNDGYVGNDTVMVSVLDYVESITFTVSPNPIPINHYVNLQYTVPATLNGAAISYTAYRKWGPVSGNLNGNQGSFSFDLWEWNKNFFGGSGPWRIQFKVNGTVVDTKYLQFSY